MEKLKTLEEELKKATQIVKDLDKQKRSASFKSLSKYSQNLFKEDYQKAVSDQFDIIEKITDLIFDNAITEKDAMSTVKRATKY